MQVADLFGAGPHLPIPQLPTSQPEHLHNSSPLLLHTTAMHTLLALTLSTHTLLTHYLKTLAHPLARTNHARVDARVTNSVGIALVYRLLLHESQLKIL